METVLFDSGVKTYRVGAGILKFNPTDPNVYARFLDSLDRLTALEADLSAAATGEAAILALREADRRAKAVLGEVFGPENDMDAIFSGMNLLAVGDNGQQLLANFLAAIEPILSDGARRCAQAEAKALA